uniref:Alpha-mannosidase n=1 Tax=Hippocampus comes TaxID=109280 RepID=A0A3Q2Y4Q0_HIPCM
EGRLEFVLGGQVMPDEAVTDLDDLLVQMTEGHGFLFETFGVRPRFSWGVDPFGASAAAPVLFALAGFDGHLISRIDYDLKDSMQKTKKLQFVWRGSASLQERQQIFTHTMDQFSYCTPSYLPFSNRSGFYWNGVALFPDPPKDGVYPNMSLPITKETNSKDLGVTVRYATLAEYFRAVHDADLVWEVRGSEDFLPYSTESHQAWTGFYASRNILKGVARRASAQLHAAETLFTLYRINYPDGPVTKDWALAKLKALRWAVSEVQHHDGITGTESPKVADMYLQHLTQAMMGGEELLAAIFLLPECHSGIILAGARHDLEQYVIVYNPLAWNISTVINVTVTFPFARVFDESRRPVPAQIQRSALSNVTYDLFILADLEGLQQTKYLISFSEKPCPLKSKCGSTFEAKEVHFETRSIRDWKKVGSRLLPVLSECYKLMFDQDTNLLHSITHLQDKRRVRVTQDFWEYRANGDVKAGPISDNYIFSANGSAVRAYEAVRMEIVPGDIITEIRQYFYRWVAATAFFLIHSRSNHLSQCFGSKVRCHGLEQTYSLGPLPVNAEVVLRTSSSLKSDRTLYTDNNGYQMMKRTHRDALFLKRKLLSLLQQSCLTPRCHRTVMLHRRLWNNLPWNLGYNLTLNDSSVVRPTLHVMLASKSVAAKIYQREAIELQHRPVVMPVDLSPHARAVVLPPNLHLLSLSIPGWNYSVRSGQLREPDYDRVLLRIMHLFEEGEDPELSKPLTINLKVAALQLMCSGASGTCRSSRRFGDDPFSVTISAKEIRTFFVSFNSRNL